MKNSSYFLKAKEILDSTRGKSLTVEERKERAIELAAQMLHEACYQQSNQDKKYQHFLAKMMEDPQGKTFTTMMTDQCFRSHRSSRVADQLNHLLHKMGTPSFVSLKQKWGLLAFKWFGRYLPSLFVPAILHMIRKETAKVILPGETEALARHLRKREKEGIRVNLNHLGEAILGEEEAERRLKIYLDDLSRREVSYVSIKASTLFSQINTLSFHETVEHIAKKLRILFRAAAASPYTDAQGEKISKFVNLDMEEYRDVNVTVAVFRKILDEPEFYSFSAGIVLQSYLPDSFLLQQELTIWAMQRVASGGAPIKIRIVKGANLAMEKIEASLRGWPQAPYHKKMDVDANFIRMLTYGCQIDHAKAAWLGIGTHNLFDIAYGMLLCAEQRVEKYVCFEMLEGMAEHIRHVVHSLTGDMLLYCPAAKKEEFQNALAYLVRRMDENTAPENFLRHIFNLTPGSEAWKKQASLFSQACQASGSVGFKLRRTQNRLLIPSRIDVKCSFENESDTDFSLTHNIKWAEQILSTWRKKEIKEIPVVVNGKEIFGDSVSIEDPSIPGKVVYTHALASQEIANEALEAALKAQEGWSRMEVSERSSLLAEVAYRLRCKRGDLIGAMVADTGKVVAEADAEVSEAIDFVEYYRRSAEEFSLIKDLSCSGKGPVLVASPWNFPAAIPCGGIAAALAAGNAVIFKPAPEAVLVGYELVKAFWDGGIPRDVLQFVPCVDDPVATTFVQDPRIAAVILTGATETACHLYSLRPGLHLYAETGGKNTMIVTGMADRDQAIRDIVQSAFGHAGQKCSAASLLILEEEVYRDIGFLRQLCDAASSLRVGSAWDPSTKINPLIRPANTKLQRGLTTLDEGESWLLEPRQSHKNPHLWSPGIKLGIKKGSFFYMNELFGPVLGVMCAKNFEDALDLANGTPYGLTAGIHSLDEREVATWKEKMVAGNLYVNRGITGAIVRRQPFGGTKASSFGAGAKAGGPNYVAQLMKIEQKGMPEDQAEVNEVISTLLHPLEKEWTPDELKVWRQSLGSYAYHWREVFSKVHDESLLQGQDNDFYYQPHDKIMLRVQQGDHRLNVWRTVAAAMVCGTRLEVSCDVDVVAEMMMGSLPKIHVVIESEEQFIGRLESGDRLRLLSAGSDELLKAAAKNGVSLLEGEVLANGRIELLHFLREVSCSEDYHRYGNLGLRENEVRSPLPVSKAYDNT